MRKTLTAFAIIISALLALCLTAATAFTAVLLLSAGIISVFVSLGNIVLPVNNIASDLSPPAMLFTGFFCVFASASAALSLYIYCPKIIRRFNIAVESLIS